MSPEFWMSLGGFAVSTPMTMPEAALYDNQGMVFRQDDIRFSRDVFGVKPEAKAKGM